MTLARTRRVIEILLRDVEPLRERAEPAALLGEDRGRGLRAVCQRGEDEIADDLEEAREERDRPAEAEQEAPRDVAPEPAFLVTVLAHARRTADDVAKERVAERRRDASRIGR